MRYAGIGVAIVAAALLQPITAIAQPGDPPFEVYIHTQSESGRNGLAVKYHADGTFELNGTNDQGGPFNRTGRWWQTADGKFCFQQNPTERGSDTVVHCKPLGRLIGRASVTAAN